MMQCEFPGCDRPVTVYRQQRSGDMLQLCGQPHSVGASANPTFCRSCGVPISMVDWHWVDADGIEMCGPPGKQATRKHAPSRSPRNTDHEVPGMYGQ